MLICISSRIRSGKRLFFSSTKQHSVLGLLITLLCKYLLESSHHSKLFDPTVTSSFLFWATAFIHRRGQLKLREEHLFSKELQYLLPGLSYSLLRSDTSWNCTLEKKKQLAQTSKHRWDTCSLAHDKLLSLYSLLQGYTIIIQKALLRHQTNVEFHQDHHCTYRENWDIFLFCVSLELSQSQFWQEFLLFTSKSNTDTV